MAEKLLNFHIVCNKFKSPKCLRKLAICFKNIVCGNFCASFFIPRPPPRPFFRGRLPCVSYKQIRDMDRGRLLEFVLFLQMSDLISYSDFLISNQALEHKKSRAPLSFCLVMSSSLVKVLQRGNVKRQRKVCKSKYAQNQKLEIFCYKIFSTTLVVAEKNKG